jgi:hypothetical protein
MGDTKTMYEIMDSMYNILDGKPVPDAMTALVYTSAITLRLISKDPKDVDVACDIFVKQLREAVAAIQVPPVEDF